MKLGTAKGIAVILGIGSAGAFGYFVLPGFSLTQYAVSITTMLLCFVVGLLYGLTDD